MCRSSPKRMVALTASWSSLLVTTSTRPCNEKNALCTVCSSLQPLGVAALKCFRWNPLEKSSHLQEPTWDEGRQYKCQVVVHQIWPAEANRKYVILWLLLNLFILFIITHLERARWGRMTLASAATNPSDSLQVSWNLVGSEGNQKGQDYTVSVFVITLQTRPLRQTAVVQALWLKTSQLHVSRQWAGYNLWGHNRCFTNQHLEELP